MNKPELISFSEFLMIAPFFDQRQFFAPEIENIKGGMEGLLAAGLIKESENSLIEIKGDVAVLTIEGPLRPGRGWYYSTGYGDIQDAIVELIDNESIKTVIQKIDSPGGTVKQAFETEEMFRELAREKNLIALITGSATSAAALMTFPASRRYLASQTAQTGSIGVVSQHIDNSVWYREYMGEIRTSVAKGELKDAGTDVRPYDEKAKLVFEGAVNKLYNIFADSAAAGLGIQRETIDAMESAVFIGDEGIEQGFADGFATLAELIEQSKSDDVFSTPVKRPAFSNPLQEIKKMDINELKAEHLDVYQQVLDRGKAEGAEALKETHIAEGQAAGILIERKRIGDIEALGLPAEFEAKAKTEDWTAEKAAVEYLKVEAKTRKETAAGMESDLKEGLQTDAPPMPKADEKKEPDAKAEFEAKITKFVEGGMKRTDAIKAAVKANPELHRKSITGGK